ncbi:MAG: uroporphyrinogen-III synthase, partial [Candidatus Bathyarchaeia archaeon]
EIPVYEQILPKDGDLAEQFVNDLASGSIHAIIFGSAQSVRNLKKILENFLPTNRIKLFMEKVTIVAIGPETAKAIKEVGLRVDVIPKSYTFNAAIEALIDYWKQDH